MIRPAFPAPEWMHWSNLKWIARSPAHMLEALNRPATKKATASPMLFGALTHHRTLVHQHLFGLDEFVVWEANDGKRQGNLWKTFQAMHAAAGREIVTAHEDARAQRLARTLLDDPKLAPYLVGDEREKDREWVSNGRKCAGRMDNVVTVDALRTLVELKTTHDASPRKFLKLARNMLYPEQLGWYADGCEAIGDPIDAAVIVAVEVQPPFARKLYRVTPELLAKGRTKAREMLEKLIRCEQANEWPAYGGDEEEFDVAPWEVDSPELVFPDEESEAA